MREKHHFFRFKLGIFWGKLGKKTGIFDWEWAEYRTLVIGRKGPGFTRLSYSFVCLFDSLRPINNLSVKQGRVFLGLTSTKLR